MIALANPNKVPEPKMTAEGKYECQEDHKVYDTREDYELHCKQSHSR